MICIPQQKLTSVVRAISCCCHCLLKPYPSTLIGYYSSCCKILLSWWMSLEYVWCSSPKIHPYGTQSLAPQIKFQHEFYFLLLQRERLQIYKVTYKCELLSVVTALQSLSEVGKGFYMLTSFETQLYFFHILLKHLVFLPRCSAMLHFYAFD